MEAKRSWAALCHRGRPHVERLPARHVEPARRETEF
jgi:hypothetical protein